MVQAQELMRRITAAAMAGDATELADCYAENAVAETPDAGTLQGRAAIVQYLQWFSEAFPDARYEPLTELEDGNVAIDEGYLVGTHTGPLTSPTGEIIAPTGKKLRLRECDVLVVENEQAVAHRFYFDPSDFVSQLGLEAGSQAPD